MAAKGILYMIPCPISDATEVGDVTPAANGRIIDTLDYFIVENVRSARRFLARGGAGASRHAERTRAPLRGELPLGGLNGKFRHHS